MLRTATSRRLSWALCQRPSSMSRMSFSGLPSSWPFHFGVSFTNPLNRFGMDSSPCFSSLS